MHTVISTGALLPVPLAEWLVKAFGPVCQINMSGGTEMCGSLVNGTPALPSYPGQSSTKALGIDIAIFAPDGTEVEDGESGELVCRKAFPNMPVMLLKDPDRKRYYNSYFAGYPRKHGKCSHLDKAIANMTPTHRRLDTRRFRKGGPCDEGYIHSRSIVRRKL